MLGRILVMAAMIAAVSVGMARCASRTTSGDIAQSAVKSVDDGGWSQRGGNGWSSTSARKTGAGEVRLGRSGDSHFYVDTRVDGASVKMMVDTGASIVALTRRDAEAIGIDVDALPVAGTARTAGGEVPMRVVMLDSVAIDGLEVRGVQAAVIDADMGVSLLGQSFLSKLDAVNVAGDMMTLR
ncbi:retropepsin-like aspartic protease family protein [Sphingopyxis sp. R3-92]|uniref:retropepsin-like aspartic protease family protein n=1 Tax=Sphingopyxis sp. R3-92 TaxID=3158553 RepID=UPI003EE4628E